MEFTIENCLVQMFTHHPWGVSKVHTSDLETSDFETSDFETSDLEILDLENSDLKNSDPFENIMHFELNEQFTVTTSVVAYAQWDVSNLMDLLQVKHRNQVEGSMFFGAFFFFSIHILQL